MAEPSYAKQALEMIHDGRKNARSSALHAIADDTKTARHIQMERHAGGSVDDAHRFAAQRYESLPPCDVLSIDFALDPAPIALCLLERGERECAIRGSLRSWSLTLPGAAIRPLMDLVDLEAPLPLERILERASALHAGEALAARTPCFPQPLFSLLDRKGLEWEAREDLDESAIVWVGSPG